MVCLILISDGFEPIVKELQSAAVGFSNKLIRLSFPSLLKIVSVIMNFDLTG